ncbi:MAG: UDP-glucuronic acid decarboxylase family protein [Desulfuromonadales bacterium]
MPTVHSQLIGQKRSARRNGAGRAKQVLVTGGAGFIGSHLCARLLADGNQVICLDDFSTGSSANIGHLIGQRNFQVIEHDISLPLHLEVEQIYNLACPASPIHYQRDPIRTTTTSVLGALNVLELARRLEIPVLQTSTSEVYGDPVVHPQTEHYWGNVNPIGRRACYDEGKRCAESIFFDYHRQHGVSIKVARIFNTYGPHMHPADGRVVSNFLVQALHNQPITIFGTGRQTRSFCYVDDMVDALIRLMNSPPNFHGPVNLGNPEEFTMLDLVELVCELTGSASKTVFEPLPEDDPRQRKPDISLASAVLGWTPSTPLREGLRLTAAYFEESLQPAQHLLPVFDAAHRAMDNPALFSR